MNDKVEEKRVEKNFSIFEYVKFSDCEVNVFVNGLKYTECKYGGPLGRPGTSSMEARPVSM